MSMNTGEKKYRAWKRDTLLFVVAVLSLLIITLWKPFIGFFVTLLLFMTIIVGSVLKAYSQTEETKFDSKDIKVLAEEEVNNSQKLLRYATAVLSFLSLLTTANGMKSFVFATSWMAYMGSFAVQSILVVFSLLLCRFFVQVTFLSWPIYIKKLTKILLVVFFCVALIVSSTFSFCYIANSAYKDSWPSDSEIIIQNYFMNEVYKLREENEYRGEVISSYINEIAKEKLLRLIDNSKIQERKELNDNLTKNIQAFNYEMQNSNGIDINEEEFLNISPRNRKDLELLYANYNSTYKAPFLDNVTLYNDIVNVINGWKNMDIDYTDIMNMTDKMISQIDSACSNLSDLRETIDNDWKTYSFVNDISTYRGTFKIKANSLIEEFDKLKTYIIKLREDAVNLDINENNDATSTELDQLLSQIYLLGIDKDVKVENLVETINDLVIKASNSSSFKSEDVKEITMLKDALMKYYDYLALENELDTFINDRVKKVYNIENYDATNWEKERNDDFNTFYTYIKSLPDLSKLNMNTEYDSVLVIEEASVLQRNLLGKLTDFEKAFNYFKYKFSIMAYFSAFIAAFFDLGAFFTGCFLYVAEYLKKE